MKTRIYPSKSNGFVKAVASKSDGHRALICASLASGTSHIYGLGSSKDIKATIEVLRKLGAEIELENDNAVVRGCNPEKALSSEIFCNESGSTLRFMIPLFALSAKRQVFTGAGRLMKRPQSVYEKLFKENGLTFEQSESQLVIDGKLSAGEFYLDGSISSQFFTGLLFALPLCDKDSILHISEPFESRSYVNLTIKVLKEFGVNITWLDSNSLLIKANQKYLPKDYYVEGDYSATAFFELLSVINQPVEITNLKKDSLQGDKVFIDFLIKCGAKKLDSENVLLESNDLKYAELDLADCPDLGPVCFALATKCKGGLKLINVARLRYKESDRIEAMKQQLAKMGYSVVDKENEVYISDVKKQLTVKEYEVDGCNDHRIVMALAILASVSDKPVVINGSQCVDKSYPEFFTDLKKTGIKLEVSDD